MTDPQPSTPAEMPDSEFLRIFVERIQKVVGWPTVGKCVVQQDQQGDWLLVWDHNSPNTYWAPATWAVAAELVRGWMRRWLRGQKPNFTVSWYPHTELWHVWQTVPTGQVTFSAHADENTALVAAFDKVREGEK